MPSRRTAQRHAADHQGGRRRGKALAAVRSGASRRAPASRFTIDQHPGNAIAHIRVDDVEHLKRVINELRRSPGITGTRTTDGPRLVVGRGHQRLRGPARSALTDPATRRRRETGAWCPGVAVQGRGEDAIASGWQRASRPALPRRSLGTTQERAPAARDRRPCRSCIGERQQRCKTARFHATEPRGRMRPMDRRAAASRGSGRPRRALADARSGRASIVSADCVEKLALPGRKQACTRGLPMLVRVVRSDHGGHLRGDACLDGEGAPWLVCGGGALGRWAALARSCGHGRREG